MLTFTTGDTGPALAGTLSADLTGATAEIHVKRPDKSVLTKIVAITTPATGGWEVDWVAGDLYVDGLYRFEIEVAFSNGEIQTFARNDRGEQLRFNVRDEYDPNDVFPAPGLDAYARLDALEDSAESLQESVVAEVARATAAEGTKVNSSTYTAGMAAEVTRATTAEAAAYISTAPAYAGARTRLYDPFTNIYASATARAKVRRALGFALGTAKSSLVNILIAGDSFSSGWKATSIGADDWATNLTGLLREAGYPITGGWVFAGDGNNPGDSRWSFSTGWNLTDTGSTYAFTSGLAGRTATYTSNTTGTVLEVAWLLANGTSVTWSLDSGAQTGTLNSASATAPTILTLTGLANTTHTITFTLPTGTTYWVVAARCRATTGLSISNAAVYGSHTDDWLPTAKAGSTFLNPYTLPQTLMGGVTPKLVFLALGANDMQHASHTLAGMKANLGTIVAAYQSAGIPVVQRVYPYMTTAGLAAAAAGSPLATGATWDQYLSAVYDVSDTNDTALVDHSNVLGDPNTLVSGGLMFSDNLHLLTPGQAAVARADYRALAGI